MNKKILLGTMVIGLAIGGVLGFRFIRNTGPVEADSAKSSTQVIETLNKKVEVTQTNINNGLAAVRTFQKNPALNATYQDTIWNPYYDVDPSGKPEGQVLNFRDSEGWLYTVALDTNKLIQVGPAPRQSLDEPNPQLDFTARYTKDQLYQKAVSFLKDQGINTDKDLSGLTYSVTTKDGKGFFFRWVDSNAKDQLRFIQVGFTIGGSLLSYTNTL